MISLLIPIALAAAEPIAPSTASTAQRGGGTATAQVFVRIVRSSASIGAAYAPPPEGAMVRSTTIESADGQQIPARITEFE